MESWKNGVLGLGLAFAIAGCGGGGGTQAPGGTGAAGDSVETVNSLVVNQDSAEQTFALEGGRYRLAWKSENCPEGVDIVITKIDNIPSNPSPSSYEYRKETRIPAFNSLLQNVPPGIYTVEQAAETCMTWQVEALRVGR